MAAHLERPPSGGVIDLQRMTFECFQSADPTMDSTSTQLTTDFRTPGCARRLWQTMCSRSRYCSKCGNYRCSHHKGYAIPTICGLFLALVYVTVLSLFVIYNIERLERGVNILRLFLNHNNSLKNTTVQPKNLNLSGLNNVTLSNENNNLEFSVNENHTTINKNNYTTSKILNGTSGNYKPENLLQMNIINDYNENKDLIYNTNAIEKINNNDSKLNGTGLLGNASSNSSNININDLYNFLRIYQLNNKNNNNVKKNMMTSLNNIKSNSINSIPDETNKYNKQNYNENKNSSNITANNNDSEIKIITDKFIINKYNKQNYNENKNSSNITANNNDSETKILTDKFSTNKYNKQNYNESKNSSNITANNNDNEIKIITDKFIINKYNKQNYNENKNSSNIAANNNDSETKMLTDKFITNKYNKQNYNESKNSSNIAANNNDSETKMLTDKFITNKYNKQNYNESKNSSNITANNNDNEIKIIADKFITNKYNKQNYNENKNYSNITANNNDSETKILTDKFITNKYNKQNYNENKNSSNIRAYNHDNETKIVPDKFRTKTSNLNKNFNQYTTRSKEDSHDHPYSDDHKINNEQINHYVKTSDSFVINDDYYDENYVNRKKRQTQLDELSGIILEDINEYEYRMKRSSDEILRKVNNLTDCLNKMQDFIIFSDKIEKEFYLENELKSEADVFKENILNKMYKKCESFLINGNDFNVTQHSKNTDHLQEISSKNVSDEKVFNAHYSEYVHSRYKFPHEGSITPNKDDKTPHYQKSENLNDEMMIIDKKLSHKAYPYFSSKGPGGYNDIANSSSEAIKTSQQLTFYSVPQFDSRPYFGGNVNPSTNFDPHNVGNGTSMHLVCRTIKVPPTKYQENLIKDQVNKDFHENFHSPLYTDQLSSNQQQWYPFNHHSLPQNICNQYILNSKNKLENQNENYGNSKKADTEDDFKQLQYTNVPNTQQIHIPTAMSSANPYFPPSSEGIYKPQLHKHHFPPPSSSSVSTSQSFSKYVFPNLQQQYGNSNDMGGNSKPTQSHEIPPVFSNHQNINNYAYEYGHTGTHQQPQQHIDQFQNTEIYQNFYDSSTQMLFCHVIDPNIQNFPQTFQFPTVPGVSETRQSKEDIKNESSQRMVDEMNDHSSDSTVHSMENFNVSDVHGDYNSNVTAKMENGNGLCSTGEFPCSNGECVPVSSVCDSMVDCSDSSDEIVCSCRHRVDKDRLCDGYFDCPHGEDELGCFSCSEKQFSCDDWMHHGLTTTCLAIEKRCDGFRECPNGKDEKECSILAPSVSGKEPFTVSYTTGFLHHNWRGEWYPACPELETGSSNWALAACTEEIGHDLSKLPVIEFLPIKSPNYDLKELFLVPTLEKGIIFMDGCKGNNVAAYVTCPEISCGTRVNIQEPIKIDDSVLNNKLKRQINNNSDNNLSRNKRYVGEETYFVPIYSTNNHNNNEGYYNNNYNEISSRNYNQIQYDLMASNDNDRSLMDNTYYYHPDWYSVPSQNKFPQFTDENTPVTRDKINIATVNNKKTITPNKVMDEFPLTYYNLGSEFLSKTDISEYNSILNNNPIHKETDDNDDDDDDITKHTADKNDFYESTTERMNISRDYYDVNKNTNDNEFMNEYSFKEISITHKGFESNSTTDNEDQFQETINYANQYNDSSNKFTDENQKNMTDLIKLDYEKDNNNLNDSKLIAGKDSNYRTSFLPDSDQLLKFDRYLRIGRERVSEENSEESESDRGARVVGGRNSKPAGWPWIVAVYQDGTFHCGGVIVERLWIMTAAHCVDHFQQHYYEVQAGMLRRFSYSPMEQTRTVVNVILHENYVRTVMQNDLALLRLDAPLLYNKWVRPICLPFNLPPTFPHPGTRCTAVGWGATVEHGPDHHMREVEVPILPSCKHIPDREGAEICAGELEGGKDTCQGDSGGPLLCKLHPSEDKWFVAGVVSHGEGCARPFEPGAYTRVVLFLDWILAKTAASAVFTDEDTQPLTICPGHKCSGGFRCIPLKNRCDGKINCLNADDEIGCTYDTGFLDIIHESLLESVKTNLTINSNNNIIETTNKNTLESNNTKTGDTALLKLNDKNLISNVTHFISNNNTMGEIFRNTLENSNTENNTMRNTKKNTFLLTPDKNNTSNINDNNTTTMEIIYENTLKSNLTINNTMESVKGFGDNIVRNSYSNKTNFNIMDNNNKENKGIIIFDNTTKNYSQVEKDNYKILENKNNYEMHENVKLTDKHTSNENQTKNYNGNKNDRNIKKLTEKSLPTLKISETKYTSPNKSIENSSAVPASVNKLYRPQPSKENFSDIKTNLSYNKNNGKSKIINKEVNKDKYLFTTNKKEHIFQHSKKPDTIFLPFCVTFNTIKLFKENRTNFNINLKNFRFLNEQNIINIIKNNTTNSNHKYRDKITNKIFLKPSFLKKLILSNCLKFYQNQSNLIYNESNNEGNHMHDNLVDDTFDDSKDKLEKKDDFSLSSSSSLIYSTYGVPFWMYRCKTQHQYIPYYKRCDGIFNCEDGSDESNCTCWDILLSTQDNYICDGIIDCPDHSDEKWCIKELVSASNNYTQNKKFILTDGRVVKYDEANNMEFKNEGIITKFNDNNTLSPICMEDTLTAQTALKACHATGHTSYNSFDLVPVKHNNSSTKSGNQGKLRFPRLVWEEVDYNEKEDYEGKQDSLFKRIAEPETGVFADGKKRDILLTVTNYDEAKYCTNINVKCYGLNDDSSYPWHAKIYKEGVRITEAALLTYEWLISDMHIFKNINPQRVYLSASLGATKMTYVRHLSVYEQNIRVDRIIAFDTLPSEFALLHLSKSAKLTHQVKPLGLPKPWFSSNEGKLVQKCLTSRCITNVSSPDDHSPLYLELITNKAAYSQYYSNKKIKNYEEIQKIINSYKDNIHYKNPIDIKNNNSDFENVAGHKYNYNYYRFENSYKDLSVGKDIKDEFSEEKYENDELIKMNLFNFTMKTSPTSATEYLNECIENLKDDERNKKSTTCSGVIVCHSSDGWYAAATYNLPFYTLCHQHTSSDDNYNFFLNNIPAYEDGIESRIKDVAVKKISVIDEVKCESWRCPRGKCLPWSLVADGKSDCEDGSDEKSEQMKRKNEFCKANLGICGCSHDMMRCHNGQCIPKHYYCDGQKHCTDGSDELPTCYTNCSNYLQLTGRSNLLCDGHWNCLDKSDENWELCETTLCDKPNVFKCRSSKVCIPNDFLCDGDTDCPEGDDESECLSISEIKSGFGRREGILMERKFGTWIPYCISDDFKVTKSFSDDVCHAIGYKNSSNIKLIKRNLKDFNYDAFSVITFKNSTELIVFRPNSNFNLVTPYTKVDIKCNALHITCRQSY